jgi:hypothetical protein
MQSSIMTELQTTNRSIQDVQRSCAKTKGAVLTQGVEIKSLADAQNQSKKDHDELDMIVTNSGSWGPYPSSSASSNKKCAMLEKLWEEQEIQQIRMMARVRGLPKEVTSIEAPREHEDLKVIAEGLVSFEPWVPKGNVFQGVADLRYGSQKHRQSAVKTAKESRLSVGGASVFVSNRKTKITEMREQPLFDCVKEIKNSYRGDRTTVKANTRNMTVEIDGKIVAAIEEESFKWKIDKSKLGQWWTSSDVCME